MVQEEKTSRRQLLRAGAALGALALLPAGRALAAGSLERMSVSAAGFPASTLASYDKAVQAMLKLPPDNPHNWYRQAIIHLIDCPHQNYWFLPWHRAYVWYFESLIQKYSGDATFALPYWDWTATPSIIPALWQGALTPTSSFYIANSSDFARQFKPAIDAFYAGVTPDQQAWLVKRGYPTSAALMKAAVSAFSARARARTLTPKNPNLPSWVLPTVSLDEINNDVLMPRIFEASTTQVGFGSYVAANHDEMVGEGPLESQPHDNVHGGIGGFMGQFLSPVDPIFWMHHANVDRLWTVWTAGMQSYGLPALPTDPNWAAEPFLFFVDANGNKVSTKAGDWVAPRGYTYQTGSGTMKPSTAQVAQAQSLDASVANADFAGAAPAMAAVTLPSADSVPDFVEVDITLTDPSTSSFLVFMNSRDISREAATPDSPNFVGTITPFGVGHHGHSGHEGGNSVRVQLPIRADYQTLKRKGLVAPGDKLDIQVVPITTTAAPKSATPVKSAMTLSLFSAPIKLTQAAGDATVRSVHVVASP